MELSFILIAATLATAPDATRPETPTNVDAAPADRLPSAAYLDSLTGEWDGPPLVDGVPVGHEVQGDIVMPEFVSPAGFLVTPWPEGVVYFQFDGNVSAEQRFLAMNAMGLWVYENSNVTFVPRTNEPHYVHIQDSCCANNSYVGMIGGGQVMNIKDWDEMFVMAHEYCHALGFWHEHSRPDRDAWVQINYDNICGDCCSGGDCTSNFEIRDTWLTLETSYDYDSVMHYSNCAFSDCTFCGPIIGCQTIEPLVGNPDIGQREFLSDKDVQDMRDVYGPGGQPRFVDPANQGDVDGTVRSPAPTVEIGVIFLAPSETLWIRGGVTYNEPDDVFDKPGVYRTYGGVATIQ